MSFIMARCFIRELLNVCQAYPNSQQCSKSLQCALSMLRRIICMGLWHMSHVQRNVPSYSCPSFLNHSIRILSSSSGAALSLSLSPFSLGANSVQSMSRTKKTDMSQCRMVTLASDEYTSFMHDVAEAQHASHHHYVCNATSYLCSSSRSAPVTGGIR